MSRKLPEPDYVVLHLHRIEPAGGDILTRLERFMGTVADDLKKMRKALDAIKAAEAKEDADAAAFADERNAKVAELTAKITDLEARPTLSEEDHAALDALRDELVAMAPAEEAEPTPTPEPPAPPDVEEIPNP